jgi:DNA-binding CsgD family transcriptional regulator
MFSIMIFSFLCRVFDAMPINGADPFAPFGGSALVALIFVGAAFLFFVALFKSRFNTALTYRLSLPIMVTGIIAIALFFDTQAALSVFLINTGYEFFDILSWILFTEIARNKDEQALHVFGFGVAFMFIGITLGLLGGEILGALILGGTMQITVIAMLSILSLVIVAFLVVPEGTIARLAQAISPEKKDAAKKEPSGAEANKDGETGATTRTDGTDSAGEPSGEGRHERNCALAAKDYHLTPRESEVLVLLAYGRTLTIIARDFHIAKGTARTHIESIYRKLDVHKQQELIDLIENYKT